MSIYYNYIKIAGKVMVEPEFKRIGSGKALLKFRVKVPSKSSLYIDVTAWEELAEQCKDLLHEHEEVIVEGRLSIRKWEDTKGVSRKFTQITASTIQSLSLGNDLFIPQDAFGGSRDNPAPEPTPPVPPFDPYANHLPYSDDNDLDSLF